MKPHTLLITILWLALGGVVYYLIDGVENPNKLSNIGHSKTVVLKRGLDGHYRSEALINGIKVNVLVDTGATGVAITQPVADKLGLKSTNAIRTQTANGDTVAYLVRLNSVQLGGVKAKHVSATITPSLQGEVLLGMSFLGKMDVRLYKNEMTIKQVD